MARSDKIDIGGSHDNRTEETTGDSQSGNRRACTTHGRRLDAGSSPSSETAVVNNRQQVLQSSNRQTMAAHQRIRQTPITSLVKQVCSII